MREARWVILLLFPAIQLRIERTCERGACLNNFFPGTEPREAPRLDSYRGVENVGRGRGIPRARALEQAN
jgi:hypothetical protein